MRHLLFLLFEKMNHLDAPLLLLLLLLLLHGLSLVHAMAPYSTNNQLPGSGLGALLHQGGSFTPPGARGYQQAPSGSTTSGGFPYEHLGLAETCPQGGNSTLTAIWTAQNGSYYYVYNDHGGGWPVALARQYLQITGMDPWSNIQFLQAWLVHLICSPKLTSLSFVADANSATGYHIRCRNGNNPTRNLLELTTTYLPGETYYKVEMLDSSTIGDTTSTLGGVLVGNCYAFTSGVDPLFQIQSRLFEQAYIKCNEDLSGVQYYPGTYPLLPNQYASCMRHSTGPAAMLWATIGQPLYDVFMQGIFESTSTTLENATAATVYYKLSNQDPASLIQQLRATDLDLLCNVDFDKVQFYPVGPSDRNTTFCANLIPCVTATYDVGEPNLEWRNGYFAGELFIAGYLNVGSASTPLNTAAGTITGQALVLGNLAEALNATTGETITVNVTAANVAGGNSGFLVSAVDIGTTQTIAYTGWILEQMTTSNSSGGTTAMTALISQCAHYGTGSINQMSGLNVHNIIGGAFNSPSVITQATGVNSNLKCSGSGNGTITRAFGYVVQDASGCNTLTVSSQIGFDCAALTAGTTNVCFQASLPTGTNAYMVQLNSNSPTPANGITWAVSPGNSLANLYYGGSGSNVKSDFTFSGLHYVSNSGTPTTLNGTGAGLNPTITLTGTDVAMALSVTAGTGSVTSAAIVTITFATAFTTTAPVCNVSPTNANAFILQTAATTFVSWSTTTAHIVFTSGPTTGLTGASVYTWNIICMR